MPSSYARRIRALESAKRVRCAPQCGKCWLAQYAPGSDGSEFAGCDGRPVDLPDVLLDATDAAIERALLGSGAATDLSDESLAACANGTP
mgnify:CR=1 FL=1